MHRSNFQATTEEQEAFTNPWINAKHSPADSRGFDKFKASPESTSLSSPRVGHVRSQSSPGHPLRPSLSAHNEAAGFGTSLMDLHETRPSLRRAIRARTDIFRDDAASSSECESHKDAEDKKEKEVEVIVHHVCQGDSLAGVALKYNVSLAALRSANKLWTNDTIHLRQQLYIPVRSISSSTASSTRRSSVDNSVEERRTESPRDTEMWDSRQTDKRAHTISSFAPKIRRVPISELSFFPSPSSTPSSSSLPSPSRRPAASRTCPKQPPLHSHPPSRNSPSLGLVNILHVAKEEIVDRLSLDASWFLSSEGNNQQPEFELSIVDHVVKGKDGNAKTKRIRKSSSSFGSSFLGMDGIPLEEVPNRPQIIRTQQLQPSAAMIIPRASKS